MNSSKQIKVGAIISYVAIFINIAAMLLYTPWMKNQIGVANYGLYNLAHSFITMFLMDFGIGSSVARFLAKYRAENNIEAANKLMGIVTKIYIAIDCVFVALFVVLYFFIGSIYDGLTAAEIVQFKELYIVIALFSVISFPFTTLSGIFNAYEKFVHLKLCDLGQKLLSITLIVSALLMDLGVTAMVLANTIASVVFIFVKLFLIKRNIPIRPKLSARDKAMLKEIFGFSIWVMILGIAQRLTYNIAPSILGVFSDSTEIAMHAPASAIAGYFYTFATAINGLFLPTISRKIAQKKEDDILPLMILVGRFQVVVLGLLWVGFIAVGREFMIMWMGEEFLPAYYCTIILAFPTIFEYSQQIANTTILAKNKVMLQSLGLLGSALINIVISSLLSDKFGAIGVCVGICITSFINLAYINVVYYKVLKINVLAFYRKCYLTIIPPIIVAVLTSRVLSEFVDEVSILTILIKGVAAVFVFFVAVWFIHIRKEEKQELLAKCRQIIRRVTSR